MIGLPDLIDSSDPEDRDSLVKATKLYIDVISQCNSEIDAKNGEMKDYIDNVTSPGISFERQPLK